MSRAVCAECGERPAKSRGLCATCRYRLDPEYREKVKASARQTKAAKGRSPGRAIDCPDCGRRRRHESGGLCASCAARERRRDRTAPCTQCGEPHPPNRSGLCQPCYLSRGPTVGVCPACGGDGRMVKGLCQPCYHRAWSGAQPRQPAKPPPPCADCGEVLSGHDHARCWSCEVARRGREHRAAPAACVECGEVKRLPARGLCATCYPRVRYRTDPEYRERIKAVARERAARPDLRAKINAQHKARWRADPEFRDRERVRKRSEDYKAAYRAYARRTQKGARVRRFGTVVLAVTDREVRALLARPCMACGTSERVTLEHLIPLARGGRHAVGNLAPLCRSCNSSKADLTWTEWRFSDRPRAVAAFGALLSVPGTRRETAVKTAVNAQVPERKEAAFLAENSL